MVYYCCNYDIFWCARVVIRLKQLRPYYALLVNRLGCIVYTMPCADVGSKPWYRSLWVYGTHSLPSRRRRKHDVLAPVRPADGNAGTTS